MAMRTNAAIISTSARLFYNANTLSGCKGFSFGQMKTLKSNRIHGFFIKIVSFYRWR
jgi:hypothetical protein